ncbi:hypothetical protein [Nocardioides convexus]|uniref:hypothetical protein n=1 Tax=Nocardioides convexus TaxID=2712224 RepID=UPI0024185DAD|nr:hypothetical protein [Nocardioides convexus]
MTRASLLEQIRRSNDRLGPHAVAIDAGRPTTIANDQGTEGALARFATASAVGLIAAFVFDGTGVEVVAYGPPEVDDAAIAADVAAMLRSVRPLEGDR